MAKFRMPIRISSDLHKCFHEAGHIEVAYLHGATVQSAHIDQHGNGITRVVHKSDLSTKKPAACGGYAAELLLFEAGRLVDKAGQPLAPDDFDTQAMENARRDKFPFYITKNWDGSRYPDSPFQPGLNDTWPPESDLPFKEYTATVIAPMLRQCFPRVEAIAYALSQGPLSQHEIEAIRSDFP